MIKKAVIYISVLVLSGFVAEAAPSATKLVKDYERAKKSLLKDELQQRKVMGALYNINKNMKKTVTEKAEMEQERLLVEAQTKDLAGRVLELDTKVKQQKSMMRFRLSAIYKLGGQGLARLLLTSQNSTQLERNLKILGVVAKKDLEMIKDSTTNSKELGKKRIKFTQRLAHLKSLESKILKKEQSLLAENKSKAQIIENLRKSKQASLKQIKNLRLKTAKVNVNSAEENEMLDLLLRPSFFEKKGQLPKPVNGPVVKNFGLIRDKFHDVVLSHKGIVINAPQGAPIKAVSEGRVAFAGFVAGFGKTVIVDHGDHYYTVYANADQLQVQEGDEVTQSQAVATAGAASLESDHGIYFEIRHFSEPTDPRQWMKGTLL